jgi:uroporphyrinogen decarboxylase
MTKSDRIAATLARRPVDRPAVAFWRHAPDVDHTAPGLADAMLAFHRRWDLDLIKVMSSGVYCVEDWGCRVAYAGSPNGAKQCTTHAVRALADWARIKPLDPGAGALGRELEAVRLIRAGRHDDAPILHTVFSPLSVARKLAGDRVLDDLRTSPDAVRPALDAITDTMARYAVAALDAGADGLFYATQTASQEVMTADENERFGIAADRRVLAAVAGRSSFTLVHAHGRDVFFDQVASLGPHAINWHDRITQPSITDARRRFAGALVGGLDEWHTLLTGAPGAIAEQARDAEGQADGLGVVVAPGCVLPLTVPDASLAAVVDAVRSARA